MGEAGEFVVAAGEGCAEKKVKMKPRKIWARIFREEILPVELLKQLLGVRPVAAGRMPAAWRTPPLLPRGSEPDSARCSGGIMPVCVLGRGKLEPPHVGSYKDHCAVASVNFISASGFSECCGRSEFMGDG